MFLASLQAEVGLWVVAIEFPEACQWVGRMWTWWVLGVEGPFAGHTQGFVGLAVTWRTGRKQGKRLLGQLLLFTPEVGQSAGE